jgi:hypothetical protein
MTDKIHDSVYSENYFTAMGNSGADKQKYGTVCSKAVTTNEFKYIRYYECDPVVEPLFHISTNPGEGGDLVQNTEYKDILIVLRLT